MLYILTFFFFFLIFSKCQLASVIGRYDQSQLFLRQFTCCPMCVDMTPFFSEMPPTYY